MASRIDRNTDCLLYLGGPSDLFMMRLMFPFLCSTQPQSVLFLPALEAIPKLLVVDPLSAVRIHSRPQPRASALQPLTRRDSLDSFCYYTLLTFRVSAPAFPGNSEQILRMALAEGRSWYPYAEQSARARKQVRESRDSLIVEPRLREMV